MEQTELIYNGEVADRLSHAIVDGGHGLDNVPALLKKVLKEDLWQERYVTGLKQNVKCKNFVEFITKKPLEGLGSNVKTLRRLCGDDPEALDELERAVQGKPGAPKGNKNAAKTNSSIATDCPSEDTERGRGYALRRLRKDRPDLHAQVIEKKLSPHAAMVEAGFRPKTITVPVDVKKAAATLVRNFQDDVLDLIQELIRLTH